MKRVPKFKKWTPVEIYWLDSMHTGSWRFEDEIETLTKDRFLLHQSVGYFVKAEKHQIVIVQSKSADGEEKSNIAEILAIPLVAVKIVKEVRIYASKQNTHGLASKRVRVKKRNINLLRNGKPKKQDVHKRDKDRK